MFRPASGLGLRSGDLSVHPPGVPACQILQALDSWQKALLPAETVLGLPDKQKAKEGVGVGGTVGGGGQLDHPKTPPPDNRSAWPRDSLPAGPGFRQVNLAATRRWLVYMAPRGLERAPSEPHAQRIIDGCRGQVLLHIAELIQNIFFSFSEVLVLLSTPLATL